MRTAALIMCMLMLCGAAALAHGNILHNPEITVAEGTAEGWSADAWDASRSVLDADAAGMDGNGGLHPWFYGQ